jgi:peptide-methionine (R)-S-oxide reductase
MEGVDYTIPENSWRADMMKRRQFLLGAGALSAAALTARLATADSPPKPAGTAASSDIEPLDLSESQWRERLSDKAFYVLREEGTERPHSSPLNAEKRAGEYVCAGCELPLFKSEWKYESGTGWPSFYTAMDGHVGTKRDFKMLLPRTEYHCLRCGGHQGHVFDDGPDPTGQRWCNNGVALKFVPA